MNEFESFVHHAQVGGDSFGPGIAVGDFFEDGLGFGGGFAVDFDGVGEIGTDGEGRVDVDEFESAFGFDLGAQWPVGEGREDEFVVAPDEFIVPAGFLASFLVEHGKGVSGLHGFGAGFIDVFDVVKGEDDVGGGLVASVSEEENVFFVGGEFIEVFFGDGLAGFDEADDAFLVGGGEVRHGSS